MTYSDLVIIRDFIVSFYSKRRVYIVACGLYTWLSICWFSVLQRQVWHQLWLRLPELHHWRHRVVPVWRQEWGVSELHPELGQNDVSLEWVPCYSRSALVKTVVLFPTTWHLHVVFDFKRTFKRLSNTLEHTFWSLKEKKITCVCVCRMWRRTVWEGLLGYLQL